MGDDETTEGGRMSLSERMSRLLNSFNSRLGTANESLTQDEILQSTTQLSAPQATQMATQITNSAFSTYSPGIRVSALSAPLRDWTIVVTRPNGFRASFVLSGNNDVVNLNGLLGDVHHIVSLQNHGVGDSITVNVPAVEVDINSVDHSFAIGDFITYRIDIVEGPRETTRNMTYISGNPFVPNETTTFTTTTNRASIPVSSDFLGTSFGTLYGSPITLRDITQAAGQYGTLISSNQGYDSDGDIEEAEVEEDGRASDLKETLKEHLHIDTRLEIVGTELCLKIQISFDDETIAEVDEAVDLTEALENLEQQ